MAKAIMIQGTMSNAGKSLLCTGLCRIFAQDGYRVAPFKSQNMALNSFVTKDGLEMGRAQVVQAEAACTEPDVRMNPLLLKPMGNSSSQVILCGEVLGNYSAREYYKIRPTLTKDVLAAYNSLAAENDIIVIEGAGSPAEINLPKDDFVNMGMARLASAPVLLVGDIDRGGVFAQLYGTVAILPEDEQKMIRGTIINKFRGDPALLGDGRDILKNLTGKPVVGVVPYIDVDIDDEDSLAERLNRTYGESVLDIAVVYLPHISNFTDFAVLEATPGVAVRYVKKADELGKPDMVIVPGSKNTIGDLRWMRQSGMEAAVKNLHESGTVIFGICGGYQMLGRVIEDNANVEGGGVISGMGLLPTKTVFEEEKHRTQSRGTVLAAGGILSAIENTSVYGYEIHMGSTVLLDDAEPLLRLENGTRDGCHCGNVYGCYLHGFFDSDECRRAVLNALAKKKGVELEVASITVEEYKDEQYNILADNLRKHIDMEFIYNLLGEDI